MLEFEFLKIELIGLRRSLPRAYLIDTFVGVAQNFTFEFENFQFDLQPLEFIKSIQIFP